MAGFNNDIFISYAHADNRDGWVDAFHASLENRLGVLGLKPRIWRDKKLGGADVFSDEILDQLKHSALLISILSPSAMRSNWCEKQKFEQYAQSTGGFRIGNVVRALKTVITPAEGDAHRAIFGALGYEFFEKDRVARLRSVKPDFLTDDLGGRNRRRPIPSRPVPGTTRLPGQRVSPYGWGRSFPTRVPFLGILTLIVQYTARGLLRDALLHRRSGSR